MKLVYDSLTGNTRYFTSKLADLTGLPMENINEYSGGKALLLTYTFGKGEIPKTTSDFLARHHAQMMGVVSGGSFHWGENFGRAGKLIAEKYGLPLLSIINKRGSHDDLTKIKEWILEQMD